MAVMLASDVITLADEMPSLVCVKQSMHVIHIELIINYNSF